MTHLAHHRRTLARLTLLLWLAWITFAVAASALPFFLEVRLWTPSGKGYWGCTHGSVYHARVHRPTVSTERGEHRSMVQWNPGTTASIEFVWGLSRNVDPKPDRTSRPFVRRAPPWAVVLMPTLLVILLARPAKFIARRLPGWLAGGLARLRDPQSAERRALLKAGRVPCPRCDYDVTGLERCPECGAPSRAVRQRRIRPTRLWRLTLVVWLGLSGAASLMPFLFFTNIEIGPVSLGMVAGGVYILHDTAAHGSVSTGLAFLRWHPSLLQILTFDAGWTSSYRYVQFPPWLVVLVPTLIAMAIRRELRYYKRRKLKKLGRTLCPACQYDTTGLEVCPECGVAVDKAPQDSDKDADPHSKPSTPA